MGSTSTSMSTCCDNLNDASATVASNDIKQNNGKVEWDFMEELLFCNLNLDEKTSHKFILNAFVDLIVGLRKTPDTDHGILQLLDQEGRN
ncbi:hypothetical protein POTOM_013339 [Populus tomentosa]|uniref:OVATE domain-containing protein n=1 Tax=Populus tomentosa TaxID=118781 RepID=A0A8X8A2I7_POPTO|nr:hypothetical protein POTOM_013339 [Populus tomentosa]